jgi:Calcineurin-like phosphoesterase
MLFLGNYVDHGDHQLDVICLLLLLVVRHPSSYFLLRGKHESRKINGQLVGRTLATACKRCFAPGDWTSLWSLFNNLFDRMPFEAVVDGRYYCASQGLATGMPTAVAQALEDSNDDGSEKVSHLTQISLECAKPLTSNTFRYMVEPQERIVWLAHAMHCIHGIARPGDSAKNCPRMLPELQAANDAHSACLRDWERLRPGHSRCGRSYCCTPTGSVAAEARSGRRTGSFRRV